MLKFKKVWSDIDEINSDMNEMFPSIPNMEVEEYNSLMGRYMESQIRYYNVHQFKFAFFSIFKEAQERLRAKLKINNLLRNLDPSEALGGSEVITNIATNPDSSPETDEYEPIPFVNNQTRQKENLSKVSGLYNWKHSVGGQAYNEFLDSFRGLFRVILSDETEEYYEQR